MKKPKKSKKTPKKLKKKRSAGKQDPPVKPESGTKKPDPGGKIDMPTPRDLPKTPPRAPGKKKKVGRPRKKEIVPEEVLEKKEIPPDPPPGADAPPPIQGEVTQEAAAARSGARLIMSLECSVCEKALPPPVSSEQRELLEQAWFDYLLSIGGQIPPWLGLVIAHGVVFTPRYLERRARKRGK